MLTTVVIPVTADRISRVTITIHDVAEAAGFRLQLPPYPWILLELLVLPRQ
jgi:hypothetical protein